MNTQSTQDRLLIDRLAELRANWTKAQRFGLRYEIRLDAIDHEQEQALRKDAFDAYSSSFNIDAAMNKPLYEAQIGAIERAAELNRLNKAGKVNERQVLRLRLFTRDGDKCWLCGEYMPETDRTVEHLHAQLHGGKDHSDNCVLTHEKCNKLLGYMGRAAKFEMRDRIRERRLKEKRS